MSSTAREARGGGSIPAGGEAASLVESAMLLRWRAPELALLLADRAVTAAQDDKMASQRADHLTVFALNRLGRHGEAAHRLVAAIGDAETPPALRHELNVELAYCAVALDEPVTAVDAVRAVLAAGDDVAPALRGRALVALAEAAIALGRDDLVSSALEEADELYREDQSLDHDTALLLRAAVRATDSARHRARSAAEEAEARAREGRELLARLADPDQDSGETSARLMLELARILLDRGAGETAMQEVRPLLRRQVRAASAGAVGRLRLMLATHVHLAEGRHEPALTLLADAVEGAQRYGVDAVLAECLEGLSHVHEARGEFADALHCMRASCAAEGRHRCEVAVARSVLLENCGSARREEARLIDQVGELLTNAGAETAEQEVAEPTAEPEVVEPEVLEEVAAQEVAAQEVAETEIPEIDAPETEVASAEAAELAELGDAGVARHRRGQAGPLVSVSDLLPSSAFAAGRSARRRAGEAAGEPADEASPVEVNQARDGNSGEGHSSSTITDDTAGGAPTERSEPIPATRREFPAAGPPPAPKPRALQWESDAGPPENAETPPLGLGDLLAEALAAYQESRDVHPHSRSTGTSDKDGSSPADAGTVRDLPRYRGPGTRWAAGLALAPNLTDQNVSHPSLGDEDHGEPSEEITNPLLRLPELTAEPRWVPPEPGRRSAAGD